MPLATSLTRRVVLLTATAGPLLATLSAASSADAVSYTPAVSAFDQHLIRDINRVRVSRGLRRLTLVAGTTDVAHHWSCHLAHHHLVAHNRYLVDELQSHGSVGWTTYGENVARQSTSYTAGHLFRLYMRDPYHRANILDRAYRYIGVWSKRAGGRRYNVTDFVGQPVGSYDYAYGAARVTC